MIVAVVEDEGMWVIRPSGLPAHWPDDLGNPGVIVCAFHWREPKVLPEEVSPETCFSLIVSFRRPDFECQIDFLRLPLFFFRLGEVPERLV